MVSRRHAVGCFERRQGSRSCIVECTGDHHPSWQVDSWSWITSRLHPQASIAISTGDVNWVACVFVRQAAWHRFYAVSNNQVCAPLYRSLSARSMQAVLLELDRGGSLCVLAQHQAEANDFAAAASANDTNLVYVVRQGGQMIALSPSGEIAACPNSRARSRQCVALAFSQESVFVATSSGVVVSPIL